MQLSVIPNFDSRYLVEATPPTVVDGSIRSIACVFVVV